MQTTITTSARATCPEWPKAVAANVAASKRRAQQRIEDVEELVEWGQPLDEVAERAGFPSIAAAARYLRRHGRPDLARPFDAYAWRLTRTRQEAAA